MRSASNCICCGIDLGRGSGGPRLFCVGCGSQQLTESWRASHAVHRAVARGDMPHARTLSCADCGTPARVYDHRDYTKPLEVDAVCGRCNVLRGPALNSLMRSFPTGLALGAASSISAGLHRHSRIASHTPNGCLSHLDEPEGAMGANEGAGAPRGGGA